MKNKKTIFTIIKVAVMIFIGLIMFTPVYMAILTSLKSSAEIQSAKFVFWPEKLLFSNYVTAMQRGDWPRYFWNSFYVTSVSLVLSLMLNSLAGYSFARLKFKGRDTLFLLSLVGLMIPQQATMIPLFVIMRNFPLAGGNNIFGQGGIGLINSYASLIFYFMANSFGVFLFRQSFLNFPEALDDAARIDGLNSFGTFLRIYVPLSKPTFAALAALRVTRIWTEYAWPLIVTSTEEMRTVQLALTLYRDEYQIRWNQLMAATVMITIPLVIVFLFAQKHFIKGVVTSGIKG